MPIYHDLVAENLDALSLESQATGLGETPDGYRIGAAQAQAIGIPTPWYPAGGVAIGVAQTVLATNQMYAVPFLAGRNTAITNVGIRIGTGSAIQRTVTMGVFKDILGGSKPSQWIFVSSNSNNPLNMTLGVGAATTAPLDTPAILTTGLYWLAWWDPGGNSDAAPAGFINSSSVTFFGFSTPIGGSGAQQVGWKGANAIGNDIRNGFSDLGLSLAVGAMPALFMQFA